VEIDGSRRSHAEAREHVGKLFIHRRALKGGGTIRLDRQTGVLTRVADYTTDRILPEVDQARAVATRKRRKIGRPDSAHRATGGRLRSADSALLREDLPGLFLRR